MGEPVAPFGYDDYHDQFSRLFSMTSRVQGRDNAV